MATILNTSPALRLLANSIEGLNLLLDALRECGAPSDIVFNVNHAAFHARKAYKQILDAATDLSSSVS